MPCGFSLGAGALGPIRRQRSGQAACFLAPCTEAAAWVELPMCGGAVEVPSRHAWVSVRSEIAVTMEKKGSREAWCLQPGSPPSFPPLWSCLVGWDEVEIFLAHSIPAPMPDGKIQHACGRSWPERAAAHGTGATATYGCAWHRDGHCEQAAFNWLHVSCWVALAVPSSQEMASLFFSSIQLKKNKKKT